MYTSNWQKKVMISDMNSFYSKKQLCELGFCFVGENVLISKKASIYGAENITIGNNVRIDDFCILSGKIEIGNYIHIGAYSALYGGNAGIIMKDFSTLSSRCVVYAISDDYSGKSLTNPMIDDKFKNVQSKKVHIGKHVIIGTNSTVLPGVTIEDGCAVGACSLINRSCLKDSIYIGVPAIKIKDRSKEIYNLEKQFLRQHITGKEK